MYRIPHLKISVSVVKDGSNPSDIMRIQHSGDLFNLLSRYYEHHDREEMLVLFLDSKNKLTGMHTVSIGTLTLSIVHPRETFKAAIVNGAAAIVLAHNHPSGISTPSAEDIALTKRLVECGKLVGIEVLDHLVIGNGNYYSFADNGTL